MTSEHHYAVYKYPFLVADEVTLQLPKGARILHVAQQPLASGDLQLWAHVDKRAELVPRRLRIYGTGHDMPGDAGKFICTVLMNGGAVIRHIYDQGEVR